MSDIEGILRRSIKNAMERSVSKLHNYATTHHRFISRTGGLERAVESEVTDGGFHGVVFLNERKADYGPCVHEGSRVHVIRPRNKRVLRWPGKGGFVFSKIAHHPGYKGDPFLYDALDDNSAEIDKIFDEEIENAVNQLADTFGE